LLAAVFESTSALDLAGAGSVSASDLGHLARGVFLADAELSGDDLRILRPAKERGRPLRLIRVSTGK